MGFLWFFVWVGIATIAGTVGRRKGYPVAGYILGAALSVLGFAIVLYMPWRSAPAIGWPWNPPVKERPRPCLPRDICPEHNRPYGSCLHSGPATPTADAEISELEQQVSDAVVRNKKAVAEAAAAKRREAKIAELRAELERLDADFYVGPTLPPPVPAKPSYSVKDNRRSHDPLTQIRNSYVPDEKEPETTEYTAVTHEAFQVALLKARREAQQAEERRKEAWRTAPLPPGPGAL